MRKTVFLHVIYVTLATFLLASCSRGVRMPKELVVIDSLVDANPDSALVLLSQMDAGKENTSFRMGVYQSDFC